MSLNVSSTEFRNTRAYHRIELGKRRCIFIKEHVGNGDKGKTKMGEDSGYMSDGGDAVACAKRRPKDLGESAHPKKQRSRSTRTFLLAVKSECDVAITPAGRNLATSRAQSKCTGCGKVIDNVLRSWASHARSCIAKKHAPSATALATAVSVGGESHRLLLCDAYVAAYSIYRRKMPFTHGPHAKEVPLSPLVYVPPLLLWY